MSQLSDPRSVKVWWENGVTLVPDSIFHALESDPSVNLFNSLLSTNKMVWFMSIVPVLEPSITMWFTHHDSMTIVIELHVGCHTRVDSTSTVHDHLVLSSFNKFILSLVMHLREQARFDYENRRISKTTHQHYYRESPMITHVMRS